jgi:hypothetical protein
MTLEETRQLGIEFERRVQTMIPEKEYLEKLDTETIYAYLNSYQDKYIHDIYRNLDNVQSGSKLSAHVESVLQSMIDTDTILVNSNDAIDNTVGDGTLGSIIENGRSVTYKLPTKFYLYIRSVSNVSSTYSFRSSSNNPSKPIHVLPNELVSESDVWRLIETPHNSLRILRYPAASLGEYVGGQPTLNVIYDQYTTPIGVKVMYYKQPQHFDLMTSTPCELPMDAFDDIVTGAVDLYVQYVAGAEARRKQQQEEMTKRAREDQRDARRGRNTED